MASFKSAFAAARKGGKSTFTWNGKSYNTKLKDESKAAPKTTGSTAKSGTTTASKGSAPTSTSRPKARAATPRPKARPTRAKAGPTVKSGTRSASSTGKRPAAKSIRQTGGKAPARKDNSAPLKDTMVGRALHKANDSLEAWRDRMKSKIKANRKPTTGSRGRGRG